VLGQEAAPVQPEAGRGVIPVYAPFFVLAGVCALVPRPSWLNRVDWFMVGCWLGCLAVIAWFWFFVVWAVEVVA